MAAGVGRRIHRRLSVEELEGRVAPAIVVQAVPHTEDFSSGMPGDADGWEYYSSTAGGRIDASTGELRMYDQGVGASLNEAILHLDLLEANNVELQFDHRRAGDGAHALPAAGSAWAGEHYNGDGVAMSADGVTWYTLESLGLDNSWTTHVIDLDAAAAAAGISYTSDFRIKFQQYDKYAWGVDGRAFDNISVAAGAIQVQSINYTQDFSSGQPQADVGWEYYSSTAGGRINASSGELRMYDQGVGASLNEAILHLDLLEANNVELQFDHRRAGDATHALPASGSAWAGEHYNGDGVAMSADGVTWYTLESLGLDNSWTTHVIDLDAAAAAAGIGYTSDFRVKFQQYDKYTWGIDGRAFDNISVAAGAIQVQSINYTQDFSSGQPQADLGWEYYSSTTGGRIDASAGELRMYDEGTGASLNEAIVHLDLTGASNVQLQFDHMRAGDGAHALPASGSAWAGEHYNGDGVAMSADGVTWYTLESLGLDNLWTRHFIDLDAAIDAAGISYTSDFRIKFQQYDRYTWGIDGRAFDNILVGSSMTLYADADWNTYTYNLSGTTRTISIQDLGVPAGEQTGAYAVVYFQPDERLSLEIHGHLDGFTSTDVTYVNIVSDSTIDTTNLGTSVDTTAILGTVELGAFEIGDTFTIDGNLANFAVSAGDLAGHLTVQGDLIGTMSIPVNLAATGSIDIGGDITATGSIDIGGDIASAGAYSISVGGDMVAGASIQAAGDTSGGAELRVLGEFDGLIRVGSAGAGVFGDVVIGINAGSTGTLQAFNRNDAATLDTDTTTASQLTYTRDLDAVSNNALTTLFQGVIYVDADATGANSGVSWTDAYTDLQSALGVARSGDEIWVAEGTYKPTTGADRAATFLLISGVDLYGGFDGAETSRSQRDLQANETILSGDVNGDDVGFTNTGENVYHVLWGVDNATVDGFTVSGGNAGDVGSDRELGGGMYNVGASPTVRNCLFKWNNALQCGGAVNSNQSDSVFLNCVFAFNQSLHCGAVRIHNESDITFTNCVFTENSATYGGAIGHSYLSQPQLTNCTFTANSADYGGAIYAEPNLDKSVCTLTNCVVWGNSATSAGDQVYAADGTYHTFANSDIEGCGGSGTGWDTSLGTDGGGNIDADPLFINPSDPDGVDDTFATADDGLRLYGRSAAIDAGTASGAPATDIMGTARPLGSGYDMGAYECAAAGPGVIYVDIDAAGSNIGTSWGDAYTDLQFALAIAQHGDEIWVAEGTYTPHASDRTASFQMIPYVDICGGFDGTETSRSQRDWTAHETILSADLVGNDPANPDDWSNRADNSYHVVIGADDAVLDGFTITAASLTGGGSYEYGGGMYNSNASPTVANCTFTRNGDYCGGGYGGAIYNDNSSPTVTNCTFYWNWVTDYGVGGAMYNTGSSPSITNCIFDHNRADDAGAIANYNSSCPILTNCIFTTNVAEDGMGGGIYSASSSSVTLTNCLFYNQWGDNAGGMYTSSASATLTNCTFSGNRSWRGGAMYNSSSSVTLTDCILWGDEATQSSDHEIYNTSSTTIISYSDIAGCGGSGNWQPGFGIDGGGNIDADPLFLNASDPDGADDTWYTIDDGLRPTGTSPVIDAGTATGAPSDDITGVSRPQGAGIDMGAYEPEVTTSVLNPGDVYVFADTDGDTVSVTYDIASTGTVTLQLMANGLGKDIITTAYAGATASSDLDISVTTTVGNGATTAGNVIATGQVFGSFSVDGWIESWTGGELASGETLSTPAGGSLGNVGDMSFENDLAGSLAIGNDVTGLIQITGNVTATGSIDIGGDITATGSIDIGGDVLDNGSWAEMDGSATGGGISNTAGRSEYPSIAILGNGQPIVVWADETTGWEVYASRWNGSSWGTIENISNDGATSLNPVVVTGADGNPIAAWTDGSSIRLSRWTGSSWSASEVVSSTADIFSKPSIAIDGDGYPVVTWDANTGNDEVYLSRWDGSAWTATENISNSAGISDINRQSIVCDGSGNPIVTWTDGTLGNNEVYVRRWNGSSWDPIENVSNNASSSAHPCVAVQCNGNPIVAWFDDVSGQYDIYVSRWDGSLWTSAENVSNNAGSSTDPSLAIGDDGIPVVAWSDATNGNWNIYARSWSGSAWEELGASATGEGISATTGASQHPFVAVGSDGNPIVAWNEDENQIYLRCWDPPVPSIRIGGDVLTDSANHASAIRIGGDLASLILIEGLHSGSADIKIGSMSATGSLLAAVLGDVEIMGDFLGTIGDAGTSDGAGTLLLHSIGNIINGQVYRQSPGPGYVNILAEDLAFGGAFAVIDNLDM